MVEYIYRRCSACAVGNVIVATSEDTSDDAAYDHCRANKIPVFRGSMDNVLERYISAAGSVNVAYIIRVCADTPFVDIALAETFLKTLIEERLDYVSVDRKKCASAFYSEAFRSDALKRSAAATKDKEDLEHVTKYMISHPGEFAIRLIDVALNPEFMHGVKLTVDYPGDLERVNAVLRELDDPVRFTSKEILDIVKQKLPGRVA